MTPLREAPVTPTVAAHTILERSVILTLRRHYFGNDRVIDVDDLVDAAAPGQEGEAKAVDTEQFSATKRLLPPKELRAARRPMGEAREFLRKVATPGNHVFGERSYIVPVGLVKEVDEVLTQKAAAVCLEATKLGARYDALVEAQRQRLGPLFRRQDYMSSADVVRSFRLDWDYVSFAAPDRLQSIDHVLAERANRKHEQRLTAAFDEVLVGLRQTALDIVSDLDDRLGPGKDGKPRVLRETALTDLTDFIHYLPKRNIGDDQKLVQAMARLERRARGLEVQDLRDDEGARRALRAAAAEAKAALAELVEDAPRRAISFGGIGHVA